MLSWPFFTGSRQSIPVKKSTGGVRLRLSGQAMEPIVSFDMFKKRLFAASSIISFFYGVTFFVATVYIPIFVQGVLGGSATHAGLILLPMMLGTGASFSVLGMAAIHHFDYRQRGSANSTLAFLRALGMTLGITLFGIIQRNLFARQWNHSETLADPRALLSPETRAAISAPVLEKVTEALSSSIAQTFLWTLVPAILSLLFVFYMGKERVQVPESEKKAY